MVPDDSDPLPVQRAQSQRSDGFVDDDRLETELTTPQVAIQVPVVVGPVRACEAEQPGSEITGLAARLLQRSAHDPVQRVGRRSNAVDVCATTVAHADNRSRTVENNSGRLGVAPVDPDYIPILGHVPGS